MTALLRVQAKKFSKDAPHESDEGKNLSDSFHTRSELNSKSWSFVVHGGFDDFGYDW